MEDQFISKSQLFRGNNLPGSIIRLRNNSYAKVMGVRNNSLGLKNVDETQLIDVIQKFVEDWEAQSGAVVDVALKQALSTKSLVIQSPSGVYISPFPLTLMCTKCKILDFYHPRDTHDQRLEKIRKRTRRSGVSRRVTCKTSGCSGHMIQVPYISVHRCGSAVAINMPHQTIRIPDVTFDDRGGSFFGSSFGNLRTGEKVATALSLACPACKSRFPTYGELNQRGTPILSGESFQPCSVQYISLNQADGLLLADICAHLHGGPPYTGLASDLTEGIVAGLLGVTTTITLKMKAQKLLHDGGQDKDGVEDIQKKIEETRKVLKVYQDDPTLPMASMIVESFEKQITDLEGELSAAQGLFKDVRKYIPESDIIDSIATERRTQEAVFFRGAFKELSIAERLADEADSEVREKMTQQWSDVKSNYGVHEILHISNLNVVLASLGYTREKREPTAANDVAPLVLNSYVDEVDESLKSRSLAYAMSAETEGLMIRLDPCKILRWCHDQFKWPVPDMEMLKDPIAARAHLLKTCPALRLSPAEVKREMKAEPLENMAPLALLHTISHCLLSVAKRHTGYDDKSLAEYLLPMDFSFLIYVTSVQNYTAGGLLTLFKHYLLPWFDDASTFALQCVFDPICSDQGCSCSGCIQTVLGCETFNHGLSRAYIHGGEAIDEAKSLTIKKGFWHG